MFVPFTKLPRPVRDKWNAKATKQDAKAWAILKALVFDEKFPEGRPEYIAEMAETAALKLYAFHDKSGRTGIGGTYKAAFSYALENLMEKMWTLNDELKTSGDTATVLSQAPIASIDEAKREQFRIYFKTTLAIVVPIMERKLEKNNGQEPVDLLLKDSSVANRLIEWIEDRKKFEDLKTTYNGTASMIFSDHIAISLNAAKRKPAETFLSNNRLGHRSEWEARQTWQERNQDEASWDKMVATLETAISHGLFDIEDGKEKVLIDFLRARIDSGQPINDTLLAKDMDMTKERVGQLFAQMGARLLETGYITLEELRQNGILLKPRLRKILGEHDVGSWGRE